MRDSRRFFFSGCGDETGTVLSWRSGKPWRPLISRHSQQKLSSAELLIVFAVPVRNSAMPSISNRSVEQSLQLCDDLCTLRATLQTSRGVRNFFVGYAFLPTPYVSYCKMRNTSATPGFSKLFSLVTFPSEVIEGHNYWKKG